MRTQSQRNSSCISQWVLLGLIRLLSWVRYNFITLDLEIKKKNEYLVGIVKLMKNEFKQVLNKKENTIHILTNENMKLREMLKLNKSLSFPTRKG
jgi:hypothetical protein